MDGIHTWCLSELLSLIDIMRGRSMLYTPRAKAHPYSYVLDEPDFQQDVEPT